MFCHRRLHDTSWWASAGCPAPSVSVLGLEVSLAHRYSSDPEAALPPHQKGWMRICSHLSWDSDPDPRRGDLPVCARNIALPGEGLLFYPLWEAVWTLASRESVGWQPLLVSVDRCSRCGRGLCIFPGHWHAPSHKPSPEGPGCACWPMGMPHGELPL